MGFFNKRFSVTVALCSHRDVKVRVWDLLWSLKKCPNPEISVKILDGDALISRSRSRVATYFMDKTKDELLCFIDDDIVVSTMDLTRMMWQAHTANMPILGAPYVTKSKENPGFAIRPLDYGKYLFGKNGLIQEMRSVSTGCMMIRREVLETLVKSGTIPLCRHGSTTYYPFFQHTAMNIDGVWEDMSEDWFFCEKAKSLGFGVYCDTSVKTEHIGQYAYTWDDIVETKNGTRKNYDNVDFTFNPQNDSGLKRAVLEEAKGESNG